MLNFTCTSVVTSHSYKSNVFFCVCILLCMVYHGATQTQAMQRQFATQTLNRVALCGIATLHKQIEAYQTYDRADFWSQVQSFHVLFQLESLHPEWFRFLLSVAQEVQIQVYLKSSFPSWKILPLAVCGFQLEKSLVQDNLNSR